MACTSAGQCDLSEARHGPCTRIFIAVFVKPGDVHASTSLYVLAWSSTVLCLQHNHPACCVLLTPQACCRGLLGSPSLQGFSAFF